ncbi:MAG: WapI family immunity protein [Chloroflexota bacterium]
MGSVRLVSSDGTTLYLWPMGYQFPDAQGDWDAHWLVIEGDVSSPRGGGRSLTRASPFGKPTSSARG